MHKFISQCVKTSMSLPERLLAQERDLQRSVPNPAKTSFAVKRDGKQQGFYAKIDPNPEHDFPDLRYLPTSASALNDTHLSDKLFSMPNVAGRTALQNKLFNATIYENSAGPLHGYKTPLEPAKIGRLDDNMENDEPDTTKLQYGAYVQVMASAEHGFRALDEKVLARNRVRRRYLGDSTYGPAYGMQREKNKAVLSSAPNGLPSNSATSVPRTDLLRINNERIAPVLSAAPNLGI